MKSKKTLHAAALLLAATFLPVTESTADPAASGPVDACYRQTVLAVQGVDPDRLSLAPCRSALREDSLTRNEKSIALHNRGVIQQAMGDAEAARVSFEHSVRLSRKVDMRNLALAQLAHKQGDYQVAVQQYELLIGAPEIDPELAKRRDTFERNRELAQSALEAVAMSAGTADAGDRSN